MTENQSIRITDYPESLNGTIDLPASKSISNRALILRALSGNAIEVHHLSDAEDTRLMQSLLASEDKELDCGNAGTALRFLTAYFAILKGERILTGNERMKERPIGPLVDSLKALGANIRYLENEGYPPIQILGKPLKGGSIELDASTSSQFVTALLLIAPQLQDGLHIQFTGIPVSRPYFNMTVQMLQYFNVKIRQKSNEIAVFPKKLTPKPVTVEADWTSASYWMGLASLFPGSQLHFSGLFKNSWQGDRALTSLMTRFGLALQITGKEGLDVSADTFAPSTFEGLLTDHPDLVPTLAVLCTVHQIPFDFQGVQALRHKETDRLEALKNELEKLGAEITITENSIAGKSFQDFPAKPVSIHTYQDHRMAMSFAMTAARHSNVMIEDPGVVEKSYPGFWEAFRKLGFEMEGI